MKSINQYINEKLIVNKNTRNTRVNTFHIDQEKFRIICMYIKCYIKEDDLRTDWENENPIIWSEMERYSEFGIDFYDKENIWLDKLGCDENFRYANQDILNQMDLFADELRNIYFEAKKLITYNSFSALSLIYIILYYLLHYLSDDTLFNKALKSNSIDWEYYKSFPEGKYFSKPIKDMNISLSRPWREVIDENGDMHKKIYPMLDTVAKAAIKLFEL